MLEAARRARQALVKTLVGSDDTAGFGAGVDATTDQLDEWLPLLAKVGRNLHDALFPVDGRVDEGRVADLAEAGEEYDILARALVRTGALHLGLLQFREADACASHLLDHWNSHVRRRLSGVAAALRRRVARELDLGLHRGSAVLLHGHSIDPRLHGTIGEIQCRPGGLTGTAGLDPGRSSDMYDVRVGPAVIQVHRTNISLVTVVVHLAIRGRADGFLEVTCRTIGGAVRASFTMDPIELEPGSRLLRRTASALGRHPSNIRCVLPEDGDAKETGARGLRVFS